MTTWLGSQFISASSALDLSGSYGNASSHSDFWYQLCTRGLFITLPSPFRNLSSSSCRSRACTQAWPQTYVLQMVVPLVKAESHRDGARCRVDVEPGVQEHRLRGVVRDPAAHGHVNLSSLPGDLGRVCRWDDGQDEAVYLRPPEVVLIVSLHLHVLVRDPLDELERSTAHEAARPEIVLEELVVRYVLQNVRGEDRRRRQATEGIERVQEGHRRSRTCRARMCCHL